MDKELSKSSNTFFTILSDYINNSNGVYELDESVINLVHIHQLEAIFYSQTQDPRLEKSYAAQLYYYQNRKILLEKIDRMLKEVPYIVVKGTSISEYYPVPFHRTMGDTDIVIHPEDRAMVDSVLTKIGFSRDYNYWYAGMEVELHNQLIYEGDNESSELRDFFNHFWPYVNDKQLNWSFHFLFVLAHLKKHLLHSGCGVRQFLDIAVLIKRNNQLDWNWIKDKAIQLGLYKFLQSVLYLCSKWFCIELPIVVQALGEDIYLYMTKAVLKNGVFGSQNKEMKLLNSIHRCSNLSGVQRVLRRIKYIFPSYDTMRGVTYYSFIEGRPFLLPVSWFYRFFRRFSTHKRKTLSNSDFVNSEYFEYVLLEIGAE